MYARKENHATCGNCKGSWPIYGTASGWMDDGLPMVKDGDRVLCPCGNNVVFASSESNAFYDEGNATATPAPKSPLLEYDQQYTLRESNGAPLANVQYQVRMDGNIIASGATDSQGRTQRIATDGGKRLALEIIRGR